MQTNSDTVCTFTFSLL